MKHKSLKMKEIWFEGYKCMFCEIDDEMCQYHYWVINRWNKK